MWLMNGFLSSADLFPLVIFGNAFMSFAILNGNLTYNFTSTRNIFNFSICIIMWHFI